jgi:phage terminase small subunit
MAKLNDQQRLFVMEYLQRSPRPQAVKGAAVAAGYSRDYGHVLMRDPDVLGAIHEEATKTVIGASLAGVKVMLKIAHNDKHKDQYKAAKDLAALNGFISEQRIVVENVTSDTKAQIEQIKTMAGQLGMDPNKLLASVGISNIEDAEFSEVDPNDE